MGRIRTDAVAAIVGAVFAVALGGGAVCAQELAQNRPKLEVEPSTTASDFTLQIRATRAAEWQALAASFAAAFSLLGAGLLVWNLREARRANSTANDALAHAKQVSDEEGRPWVSVEIVPVGFHPKTDVTVLFFEIRFRNGGKRVAKSVWFSHQIFLERGDSDSDIAATNVEIETFRRECRSRRSETTVALIPGEEWVYPGSARIDAELIPPFQVGSRDWILPAVAVVVCYRSDEPDERETFRSVVISQQIDGQLRRGISRRTALAASNLYAMQRGGTHVS